MKTSNIEVHDMLSVLSVVGVEQRIGAVPGVESVTVNFAAGNATVRYDETRLDIADIRSAVRQNEFESDAPAAAPDGNVHSSQNPQRAPAAPPARSSPGTPASPSDGASKSTPVNALPDDKHKDMVMAKNG